jgi:hypothetical protein
VEKEGKEGTVASYATRDCSTRHLLPEPHMPRLTMVRGGCGGCKLNCVHDRRLIDLNLISLPAYGFALPKYSARWSSPLCLGLGGARQPLHAAVVVVLPACPPRC